MNELFQRLMGDAARLTRTGDLRGAAQAIQEALKRASVGTAQSTQPAKSGASSPQSHDDELLVVDVEAREVPEPLGGPDDLEGHAGTDAAGRRNASGPAAGAQPEVGRFISGRHSEPSGTREYKLFVPPGEPDAPRALVVMLHGCTQDPDDFAAGTAMNEEALAHGFLVLYPAQAQQANAQRCWNWFKHSHQQRGRGEPALLAGMTRAVMTEHGVDPDRVYVAGLSAGGAMAAILGETYPDLFAAVGVHSGLPPGAATDVGSAFAAMKGHAVELPMSQGFSGLPGLGGSRAPRATRRHTGPIQAAPTIVFHGDRDTTVHPANGEQVVAHCLAPDTAHQAEGALPPVEQSRGSSGPGHAHTRRVHRDVKGRVVAEHWVIHGAGHAWSGGRPQGSYTDARGPSATHEMLRFFRAHGRRQAP